METDSLSLMPVAPAEGNALTTQTMSNHLFKVAKMYADSRIVPTAYQGKPADCFVAVELASRMNLSPMVIMQNLYVVQGKPAWGGQGCIALINGSGQFSPLSFRFVGERGTDTYGCYCEAVRKSDGETLRGTTVTLGMAKAEGWLKNPKWVSMTDQMLKYRAASFFARTECPAALMGFQTAEEVEDVVGTDKRAQKVTITLDAEDSTDAG